MIRFSVLILCLLICVGCGPQQVTVEDHQSTPTHIELQPPVTIKSYVRRGEPFESTYTAVPERVVAVWQNSIETIIALGEGDRIVAGIGIPDRKYVRPEYREAYDKIPYKDMKYANLETVLMMKPDLLVGWKSTFTNKGLQPPAFWQARQSNVYIAESSLGAQSALTMDMEYKYIRDLGHIFNRSMEAERLVHEMQQSVDYAVAQTANEKAPKALFIEVEGKHFRLYGHKTLAGNIGDALHADLIDTETPSISMEDVVKENPDVIFLIVSDGEYSQADTIMNYVLTHPGLQRVNALRNKRVYFLPLLAVYSPGIRLSDGIDIVSHGLYPDLYPQGVPDLIH